MFIKSVFKRGKLYDKIIEIPCFRVSTSKITRVDLLSLSNSLKVAKQKSFTGKENTTITFTSNKVHKLFEDIIMKSRNNSGDTRFNPLLDK